MERDKIMCKSNLTIFVENVDLKSVSFNSIMGNKVGRK